MNPVTHDRADLPAWRALARDSRGLYEVEFAQSHWEVMAAQRLRFEVFNLELGEGLAGAHLLGRDADEFDDVCEHLLVRELATGDVVGTYRLQTGWMAAANYGYYSEREFDLRVWEPVRHETLEVGRACVAAAHRNLRVLGLLWRGIAAYAQDRQLRYLIGCSSVRSQDEAAGLALYERLRAEYEVPASLRCEPRANCRCRAGGVPQATLRTPRLLQAYLSLGARIGSPPAIDRQFGTIDFLTVLDLEQLNPVVARSVFGTENGTDVRKMPALSMNCHISMTPP